MTFTPVRAILRRTAEEAKRIRAAGEEPVALAEAGRFPFDGSMPDFRPDPAWPDPTRPHGWERPRASS
ncbi:hypothetical protein [Rhizomonospora bruguierae]|uniref:hypothetical protein n=1 Tax=Rhizomonospora bruguierae TaxID=1581705 RepID=UPI001BCDEA0D|nr:hypothetical protein [Micromonospora sp. NBRC 107566]